MLHLNCKLTEEKNNEKKENFTDKINPEIDLHFENGNGENRHGTKHDRKEVCNENDNDGNSQKQLQFTASGINDEFKSSDGGVLSTEYLNLQYRIIGGARRRTNKSFSKRERVLQQLLDIYTEQILQLKAQNERFIEYTQSLETNMKKLQLIVQEYVSSLQQQ